MVVFMLWNATGTWRQIRHRHKQKCAPEAPAARRPFRQRHPGHGLRFSLPYDENRRLCGHIRSSQVRGRPVRSDSTNEAQVQKVAGDRPIIEIVGKPDRSAGQDRDPRGRPRRAVTPVAIDQPIDAAPRASCWVRRSLFVPAAHARGIR
jgi:hypothetical protein